MQRKDERKAKAKLQATCNLMQKGIVVYAFANYLDDVLVWNYNMSAFKQLRCYCLVWATTLLLTVIGLIFSVLVSGYNSFNCSMYHVPVPTLFIQFVWLYFKQLLLVAGSATFWYANSRSLQSILYQFLCICVNLYDYPSSSYLCCW